MYPTKVGTLFSATSNAGRPHSIAPGLRTNSPFNGPHTTSIVATSSATGSSDRRQKMTPATIAKAETKTVSRVTLYRAYPPEESPISVRAAHLCSRVGKLCVAGGDTEFERA